MVIIPGGDPGTCGPVVNGGDLDTCGPGANLEAIIWGCDPDTCGPGVNLETINWGCDLSVEGGAVKELRTIWDNGASAQLGPCLVIDVAQACCVAWILELGRNLGSEEK